MVPWRLGSMVVDEDDANVEAVRVCILERRRNWSREVWVGGDVVGSTGGGVGTVRAGSIRDGCDIKLCACA